MSRQATLLLLLSFALGALIAWPLLSQSTDGPTVPSAPGAAASTVPADVQVQDANGERPAAPGVETGARVEAAVLAGSEQSLPIPPDAKWVELTVVTAGEHKPVAGAEVAWIDQRAYEYSVKALPPDAHEERRWLWRDESAMARRFGWHSLTDGKGRVRVHLGEWTHVFASSEGLFGTLNLEPLTPRPADGFVLELQPDLTLRVQVLAQDGAPVVGVPVGIARLGRDGKVQEQWDGGEGMARTEAPDGIASLRHLQLRLRGDPNSGPSTEELRAATHRALAALPGVTAHADFVPSQLATQPPSEPLVLRLPACGRVKARAELRGRPLSTSGGDQAVGLQVQTEQNRRGETMYWGGGDALWRASDLDGWARFPFVACGLEFTAYVRQGGGWLQQKFSGPTAAGQEVTVVVAVPEDQVVLLGRVLDDQSQLLRDTLVEYSFDGAVSGSGQLRTDGDGRFAVLGGRVRQNRGSMPAPSFPPGGSPRGVNQGQQQNQLTRFEITWRRDERAPLRAGAPPRELQAGEVDLGDFALGEGRLLVAGRFEQGGKPCTRPINVQVEKLDAPDRQGRERWSRVRNALLERRLVGEFVFRGDAPPGRLRLSFPDDGSHLPIAPIDFAPGTKDLVIAVDAGAALVVTALVPNGFTSGLRSTLVPKGASAATPNGPAVPGRGRDPLAADGWSYEPGHAQLRWSAVPVGSYTLELRLWPATQPLVTIADVQLPLPESGDPRLVDIDLTAQIEIVTLRFLGPDGKPYGEHYGDGFVVPLPASGDEWLGFYAESGVRLALPPGPADLLVAIGGHRPQEVRGARGVVDVRLEPWPQIELRIADLPPLPQGCQLIASLQRPDGAAADDGRYRTQWNGGSRSDYMQPQLGGEAVVDGIARLTIGDGPHRLQLRLARQRKSAVIGDFTPQQVFAGPAPVQVRIDPQALQRALTEVQPDAPKDK